MKSALLSAKSFDSSFALSAQPFTTQPTTRQVAEQYFTALGRNAPGSFDQDINAYLISRETGEVPTNALARSSANIAGTLLNAFTGEAGDQPVGSPLTKEAWEQSEYYREGLPYKEGMTDFSASILADLKDEEDYTAFLNERATGWQGLVGTVSAVAGAMTDPKNLTVGLGVSAVATPVFGAAVGVVRGAVQGGRAALTVSQLSSSAIRGTRTAVQVTGGGRVAIVASEAAVSTIPSVVSGLGNAELTQQEYTVEDAFIDFAASIVLSTGMHIGGRAIGRTWDRFRSVEETEHVAAVMQRQMEAGEVIDVEPLMQAQMSGKVTPFTSLTPDELMAPTVVKRGKRFEAFYENEQGIFTGVKASGLTEADAIAQLKTVYNTPDIEHLYGTQFPPEYRDIMREYMRTDADFNNFNRETALEDVLRNDTTLAPKYTEAVRARDAALEELDTARRELNEIARRGDADPADVAALEQVVKKRSRAAQEKGAQLRNLENTPEFAQARVKLERLENGIKEYKKQMERSLLDIQQQAVQPAVRKWVQRQTDPSETRSADPIVQQVVQEGPLPAPPKLSDNDMATAVLTKSSQAEANIAELEALGVLSSDDIAYLEQARAEITQEYDAAVAQAKQQREIDTINCLRG